MMDATLLSHKASGGHGAVATRNSIMELWSSTFSRQSEYYGSSRKNSRTIAENLPNHSLNDMQYYKIPLRAAIPVLAGGVDIRFAGRARFYAATPVSRNEGIKLPC
jgi:hypothetical protein